MIHRTGVILASLLSTIALAQTPAQPAPPPPPRVVSPEVRGHDVTFRFRDPNAQKVMLSREGTRPVPMERGEDGVWSLTVGPLDPDFYGYSFVADGVGRVDPVNPLIKPNLLGTTSMVHIPGEGLTWEVADVPHGKVHHHFYRSAVVGDDRDFFVYTPPDYDASGKRRYPVLYLLHGFSDDASAWTSVGRANFILDNLIAQGKAKPMIVVMPLGYGAPEILQRGPAVQNPEVWQRNIMQFREALLKEVIPQVEKQYRVLTNRDSRAIAGLSMGGAESLYTGLNTLDRFAWVGGFSSGGLAQDVAANFPNLTADANRQLRLLWIACGTDDRLIDANRKLREWLTSKDVKHTDIETPGAHTWMVWRRNLSSFVPLLFQAKQGR